MAALGRHHHRRAPSVALLVAIVIAASVVRAPSVAALDADAEIPVQITVRQPTDVQYLEYVTIDAWLDPIPPAGVVWARIGSGAAAPLEKARGNRFTGRLLANGAIGHNDVTVTVEGAPYTATPAVTSLEILPIPTVTTLTVAPTAPIPGATFRLTAKVAVAHPCCGYDPSGQVQFFAWTGGTSTYLGTGTLDAINVAKLDRPGLPAGTYTVSARYLGYLYLGPSDSPKVSVNVARASSTVVLTPPPTTQTHHRIEMTAAVTARSGWADGATITFASDDATDPGCVVTASTSSAASCTIASLPPGTYTYQAMYSGNATVAPSSSVKKTFTVTEDTVEATDVGVDASTFYPVVDGYRDVLTVKGTRAEAVGVAIDVLGPSGATVRTMTVPAGTGPYAVTWNGRSAGGSLLAGGTYQVVQRLADAAGTKRTVTTSVGLSHKKLVYDTVYVTGKPSSYVAAGTDGGASVSKPGDGSIRIVIPSGGWAGVGWRFTLPAAPAYRSPTFQVYAKAPLSVPRAQIAPRDWTRCPDWSTSCFGPWVGVGAYPSAYAWYSAPGPVTSVVKDRVLDGMLSVPFGTVTVTKVRVKVSVGTLH